MDTLDPRLATETSRRRFLGRAALGTAGLAAAPALAQQLVDLRLPGGNAERPMTSAFPGKGNMILQRIHPPLLETPMDVFDTSVFTPNDQFFVRWHWADIPTSIDVETFRLNVFGHVNRPLSISLAQLLKLPRVELAAVNQCSGMRIGRPSSRPMPTLSRMALATTPAMPARSGSPAARIVAALTDAPSSTTATSSRYLALNAMPSCHRSPGVHRLRTAVPIRMARTNASSHALPASARSPASSA